MNRRIRELPLLGIPVMLALGSAGIPEPDAILHGALRIGGVLQVSKNTDVVVTAKVIVGAEVRTVAQYRMGDNTLAGNLYVLRIRLESLADGSSQSENAARAGQDVRIYVQKGIAAPVFIREYGIKGAGTIKSLNLDTSFEQANCAAASASIDLADHASIKDCLRGEGVAATPACACADIDGDADVDLRDWGRFQTLFTGSTP